MKRLFSDETLTLLEAWYRSMKNKAHYLCWETSRCRKELGVEHCMWSRSPDGRRFVDRMTITACCYTANDDKSVSIYPFILMKILGCTFGKISFKCKWFTHRKCHLSLERLIAEKTCSVIEKILHSNVGRRRKPVVWHLHENVGRSTHHRWLCVRLCDAWLLPGKYI
jgi:hypothetical protein